MQQQQFKVFAASCQGVSHIRSGQPCQDAFYVKCDSGVMIAAICDGLGSKQLSHIGSETTSKFLVEAITKRLSVIQVEELNHHTWEEFCLEPLLVTIEFLESLAATFPCNVSDLASTVILTVATDHFVATCHIGDGAVVLGSDEHVLTLSKPENGDYVNTVDYLSRSAIARARYIFWEGNATDIAIFTDGFQSLSLSYPQYDPSPKLFPILFTLTRSALSQERGSEKLRSFLLSEKVSSKTDDDVTLFLCALMRQQ